MTEQTADQRRREMACADLRERQAAARNRAAAIARATGAAK